MDDKTLELLYVIQIQQIDMNRKLMDKWSEIGNLISDILETHQKTLAILQDESKKKNDNND